MPEDKIKSLALLWPSQKCVLQITQNGSAGPRNYLVHFVIDTKVSSKPQKAQH
jgi:hypothetical protein